MFTMRIPPKLNYERWLASRQDGYTHTIEEVLNHAEMS
jgi:hypothetical protein